MEIKSADLYGEHVGGLIRKENRARLAVFVSLFALSIVVYLQYEPLRQPTGGDFTMWDYMAQAIVRGEIPYKDVVNIKTPLGSYLSAGAITVTHPFGLRDVFAIRYLYIILAALTAAMTYLVTEVYWGNRARAIAAALIMLSYDSFGVWNASGTQVKTAALLFGLFSLYATARGKPVLAGIAGMLSFWCWQPGLLFVGVAGLVYCGFLTRPFDRKAIFTAVGAAATLIIGLAYLYYHGAAADFYRWCITFNTTSNSSVETASGMARALIVINKSYPGETLWFKIFLLGFLWRLIDVGRDLYRYGIAVFLAGSWRTSLEIAFAVYGIFSIFNLQSGPDVIFFLPFISAYAAYFLFGACKLLEKILLILLDRLSKLKKVPQLDSTIIKHASAAVLIAIIFFFKVADSFTFEPSFTLQDEERVWSAVTAQLLPEDRVYAQASLDLLVLYNLKNAGKYIYFDRGKDVFAGRVEPGGFDAIIDDLKRKSPKFVSLAKLQHIKERDKLLQWMKEDYEPFIDAPSTNSGINMTTYNCSVYKIKSKDERQTGGRQFDDLNGDK